MFKEVLESVVYWVWVRERGIEMSYTEGFEIMIKGMEISLGVKGEMIDHPRAFVFPNDYEVCACLETRKRLADGEEE